MNVVHSLNILNKITMHINELSIETDVQEAPYGIASKAADTLKGLNPFSKVGRDTADNKRSIGDFMNSINREFKTDVKTKGVTPTLDMLIDFLDTKFPPAGATAPQQASPAVKQQPDAKAQDIKQTLDKAIQSQLQQLSPAEKDYLVKGLQAGKARVPANAKPPVKDGPFDTKQGTGNNQGVTKAA